MFLTVILIHLKPLVSLLDYLLQLFDTFIMIAASSRICFDEVGQQSVFLDHVLTVNLLENAHQYMRYVLEFKEWGKST